MREVRLRRRYGIRALSFAALVPEEAKNDRIFLRLTGRIRYTSPEQIDEYASVIGHSASEQPLFRVRRGRHPGTWEISVGRSWLFTGSGRLSRPLQGGAATLFLDLKVNPARFRAHHPTDVDWVALLLSPLWRPRKLLR